jgi:hypothetical protein
MANMARKCHRQKTGPILFLLRSSSLGEGCTGRRRTRKSSWTLFVLLVDCLLIDCLAGIQS